MSKSNMQFNLERKLTVEGLEAEVGTITDHDQPDLTPRRIMVIRYKSKTYSCTPEGGQLAAAMINADVKPFFVYKTESGFYGVVFTCSHVSTRFTEILAALEPELRSDLMPDPDMFGPGMDDDAAYNALRPRKRLRYDVVIYPDMDNFIRVRFEHQIYPLILEAFREAAKKVKRDPARNLADAIENHLNQFLERITEADEPEEKEEHPDVSKEWFDDLLSDVDINFGDEDEPTN